MGFTSWEGLRPNDFGAGSVGLRETKVMAMASIEVADAVAVVLAGIRLFNENKGRPLSRVWDTILQLPSCAGHWQMIFLSKLGELPFFG